MKYKINHFGFVAPFYERFIQPKMPEKIMTLLDLPSGGIVLDAGGGTGRIAQFFAGKASRIVVVDESFEMLREAKKKSGLYPTQAHIETLPFADLHFDGILMVDVFHHVADQPKTVDELWRVLKAGGRLVIEEPDIRSMAVKLVALAEKVTLMRSHFLAPQQIADLFSFRDAEIKIVSEVSISWIVARKKRQQES